MRKIPSVLLLNCVALQLGRNGARFVKTRLTRVCPTCMVTVGLIQARAPDLGPLVHEAIQCLDLAAGTSHFHLLTSSSVLDLRGSNWHVSCSVNTKKTLCC